MKSPKTKLDKTSIITDDPRDAIMDHFHTTLTASDRKQFDAFCRTKLGIKLLLLIGDLVFIDRSRF